MTYRSAQAAPVFRALQCAVGLVLFTVTQAQDFGNMRASLVREIEQNVSETSLYIGRRALDARVMAAIGKVRRHEFVPAKLQLRAYDNRPLPIGYGQTISQPYIVALMTDLLEPGEQDKVLEIGTGSSYQAAVLAELVDQVYSIEIIDALSSEAELRLQRLGYNNVETKLGDGYYGWPDHAPFDAIIVAQARTGCTGDDCNRQSPTP